MSKAKKSASGITIGMRPSHPGSYVRNWVLPERMTVTEAARHLGVARQALDAFLNGRASLSPEMALRIERAFGDNMDGLIRMQAAFDAYMVRLREKEIAAAVKPYRGARKAKQKAASSRRATATGAA